MEAAINVSTSGGNHNADGAMSYADAMSVTECATVNDVTMTASAPRRRNGITRHNRNNR